MCSILFPVSAAFEIFWKTLMCWIFSSSIVLVPTGKWNHLLYVDNCLKLCTTAPRSKQLDPRSRKNVLMMQLWQQWSAVQRHKLSEIWVYKPDWLILSEHTNDPTHTQTASNNPSTTYWFVKLHHSGPKRRSVGSKSDHVCQTSRDSFWCLTSSFNKEFMLTGRWLVVKTSQSLLSEVFKQDGYSTTTALKCWTGDHW